MFFGKTGVRQALSRNISEKTNPLMALVSLLSVSGTVVVLSGGVWDAVSHVVNEPELFWTAQHAVVYAGVGMSAVAGLISCVVLRTAALERFALGVKILAAGSVLQIVSGFGDSVSHEIFGIDGLLSLSHQPLELGLILVALGGLLILKNVSGYARRLLPFSIASLLAASSWLGFNLMLPLGGTLMCIPIYAMFSSGCAVM